MRMLFGVWLLAALALAPACAFASDKPPRFLLFSGVDLSELSQFVWSGADAPLFGSRNESGAFVRVWGGGGKYRYDNDTALNGRVEGQVMSGEAMLGWRMVRPTLTTSFMLGAGIEDHQLDQTDPTNEMQGQRTGLAILGELYWRPAPAWRLDGHAGYDSAFETYRARLAGGRRVRGDIFAGLEVEASTNTGSEQQRLGVVIDGLGTARIRFKASAGAAHGEDEISAYARMGADVYW